MRLKTPAVLLILTLLFLVSLGTRSTTTGALDSPYFEGTSAMALRHAVTVSNGTSLATPDTKANHPAGYVPARYRAAGLEVFTGWVHRAVGFFSEDDGRATARREMAILSALCVFTVYALARRIWASQAAGLLAAFLVAFLEPLVAATNGRVFSHTIAATFLMSLHAALVLAGTRALTRRAVVLRAGALAVVAFALLATWEPALYLLAAWSVLLAVWACGEARARTALLAAHLVAIVVAAATVPHLAATRGIASWMTAVCVASLVVAYVPARRIAGWRTPALLAVIALAVTVVATPVRAGAEAQFPAVAYVLARVRYLFGRPESATELSEWMRYAWSLDHAPLRPHTALQLFLPLGMLAVAVLVNAACRARRAAFVAGAVVCALSAAAVLVDRSVLPVAAVASIPFVAGSITALGARARVSAVLVVAGAFVAFAGVVFRAGAVDASFQIARLAGVAARDPHAFLWVSTVNTDRELVRFIATRTSVRDCVLAPDDLSGLLLAFTGRTIASLPGTTSRAGAEDRVALTRTLYEDEASFYALCRERDVDYVVYSIDMSLDRGRYSPLYTAGQPAVATASAAFRMHFEPESLRHFTLQYQNDHYRLFKVTETSEPVFLTDHPLFYQRSLLDASGGDPEEFRERVVHLMLTYADAQALRAAGDAAGARAKLAQCVQFAPRFTDASLELADAYMDLGRFSDARAVVNAVIAYAPDHPRALYYAAYTNAQLGDATTARQYLTVLFASVQDADVLERARLLQAYLDQGEDKTARPRR